MVLDILTGKATQGFDDFIKADWHDADLPKQGTSSLRWPEKMEDIPELANGGINGYDRAGNVITEIYYKPSSGAVLKANPTKTTTVLGSFEKDMKNIINEMGNVKSTYYGVIKGGFNTRRRRTSAEGY